MFSLRDFWRRHRRKAFISVGVIGSGYLFYKLYEAHKNRLAELEREFAIEQESNEIIKAQMKAHFEGIQKIADTTTFPHAVDCLNSRLAEVLDLSHLTERLKQGKDQSNSLSNSEKLEIWDTLKILSFTRMASSVWGLTMLSLYVRAQVNILGRHLYIDTARGLGSSQILDDGDAIDMHGYQQFLASANFLPNSGFLILINYIQIATTDILRGKQLKDIFSASLLHDTILQILDKFMTMGKPHNWVDSLVPRDTRSYEIATPVSNNGKLVSDVTEFDQLMAETRAVLSSPEFGSVIEISLRTVVTKLVDEMVLQTAQVDLLAGMPLAKILPRVTQMGPFLLEETNRDQFIKTIQEIPDVELFFTLVYSNAPTP